MPMPPPILEALSWQAAEQKMVNMWRKGKIDMAI
jgi:hypothetical protein